MRARSSFSYAVLRVVPRVEREEFVNAGVVLHCPERRFLGARIELDEERLLRMAPGFDVAGARRHLEVIQELCAGRSSAGPLAALPVSERFHWVVAPRSTIVQTSAVHAGLTEDPEATLQHLLVTMVRLP